MCLPTGCGWLAVSAASDNVDKHHVHPQQDGVGSQHLRPPTSRSTEWGTVGDASGCLAAALRPRRALDHLFVGLQGKVRQCFPKPQSNIVKNCLENWIEFCTDLFVYCSSLESSSPELSAGIEDL